MKIKKIIVFLLIFVMLPLTITAHSGRTDSEGGHNSSSGYHYHHGMGPHQHPNGICPYDNDYSVKTKKEDDPSTSYAYRNIVPISNSTSKTQSKYEKEFNLSSYLTGLFVLCFLVLPFGYTIYEYIVEIIDVFKDKQQTMIKKENSNIHPQVEQTIQKYYCPKCGGVLKIKHGKYGSFIGCSNYPKCKYTKSLKRTKD